ncbi:aconitase family protein, partial [Escherichia coli]|uniref:aconitase family protein n=2 Tax=Pseudomonadota TaxID=1224 RepID=UPI002033BF5F
MSIEGGARAGLIAPDEKAYEFLKGRPMAPTGAAWDAGVRYWNTLRTDEGAHFDHEIRLDAAKLPPIVTWG